MLSILIPTIHNRQHVFEPLMKELQRQCEPFGDKIEILFLRDDKTMTLATKRAELYDMSTKKYSVQWDDDDWIHPLGIELIMKEIEQFQPDSVSYKMVQEFDGKPHESIPGKMLICDFKKRYAQRWLDKFGFDIVEPTNTKCVIKTDIARKISKLIPSQTRYGEDSIFGRELYKSKLLKVESYIDKHIYWYLNRTGDPFGRWRYKPEKNNVI